MGNTVRRFGSRGPRVLALSLAGFFVLTAAACGGGGSTGGAQSSSAASSGGVSGASSGAASSGAASSGDATAMETTGSMGGGTTGMESTEATGMEGASSGASGEVAELARAEVGQKEIVNMLPADGRQPDQARRLPENPPEGIEVYPATTNRVTEKPIDYGRTPPTNGDHDPLWQNCGFYEKPLNDRHVVHSMDHGVVWITHSPDLPADELKTLRSYGEENYVVVSPYPGQNASVTATSWRVQLELDGAEDPRLREFVDGFRVSEIAPLSGNRCTLGVGNPEVKPSA